MAIYSNLTIDQGSTFTVTIDVTDASDNILNLTGYSGEAVLKKHPSSTSFTSFSVGITSLTGQVAISLTEGQTLALESGRHQYDVRLTAGDGTVSRMVEGSAMVTAGIFTWYMEKFLDNK